MISSLVISAMDIAASLRPDPPPPSSESRTRPTNHRPTSRRRSNLNRSRRLRLSPEASSPRTSVPWLCASPYEPPQIRPCRWRLRCRTHPRRDGGDGRTLWRGCARRYQVPATRRRRPRTPKRSNFSKRRVRFKRRRLLAGDACGRGLIPRLPRALPERRAVRVRDEETQTGGGFRRRARRPRGDIRKRALGFGPRVLRIRTRILRVPAPATRRARRAGDRTS